MATMQWRQKLQHPSAARTCYVVHTAQRSVPAMCTASSSMHVLRPQHACLADDPSVFKQVRRPQPCAEPGRPAARRRRHPPQSPGSGPSRLGVLPAARARVAVWDVSAKAKAGGRSRGGGQLGVAVMVLAVVASGNALRGCCVKTWRRLQHRVAARLSGMTCTPVASCGHWCSVVQDAETSCGARLLACMRQR